ncbi:hypothetical protein N9V90_00480 [Endozoicomonas sp.]|nr:hypothetical protein [Endozoicomonas sp.]
MINYLREGVLARIFHQHAPGSRLPLVASGKFGSVDLLTGTALLQQTP